MNFNSKMHIFHKRRPIFLFAFKPKYRYAIKNKSLYSQNFSKTERLLARPQYYAINQAQLFEISCLIETPEKYDLVLNYFLRNFTKTLRNKHGKDIFLKLLSKANDDYIWQILHAIAPGLGCLMDNMYGSLCLESVIFKISDEKQMDFLGNAIADCFNVGKDGCSDFVLKSFIEKAKNPWNAFGKWDREKWRSLSRSIYLYKTVVMFLGARDSKGSAQLKSYLIECFDEILEYYGGCEIINIMIMSRDKKFAKKAIEKSHEKLLFFAKNGKLSILSSLIVCGNRKVEKETAKVVLIGSIALVAIPSDLIRFLFKKAFEKADAKSIQSLWTYVSAKFGDLVRRQNFSLFLGILGDALKDERKKKLVKLIELNKGLIDRSNVNEKDCEPNV